MVQKTACRPDPCQEHLSFQHRSTEYHDVLHKLFDRTRSDLSRHTYFGKQIAEFLVLNVMRMRDLRQGLLIVLARFDRASRDSVELYVNPLYPSIYGQKHTHSSESMKDSSPVNIVATDQAAFQLYVDPLSL
jgi:hypothetical protein